MALGENLENVVVGAGHDVEYLLDHLVGTPSWKRSLIELTKMSLGLRSHRSGAPAGRAEA